MSSKTKVGNVVAFASLALLIASCPEAEQRSSRDENGQAAASDARPGHIEPFGLVGTNGSCNGDGLWEAGEVCDNGPAVAGCDESGAPICTVVPGYNCVAGFCVPKPGFTCTGNPGTCTTVCGDGIRAGAEQCDEGGYNSDSLPDRCRTDCTNHRCGDAVEDNGPVDEFCDDGVFNGAPGACNDTCTGIEPDDAPVSNAMPMTSAPAGTVGLLLSDSYLLSLCLEVDLGNFAARDAFLENNAFFAGRIVTTAADVIVTHPILVVDSGVDNGDVMETFYREDSEPLIGEYFVPAGSRIMIGIAGGGPRTECCGRSVGACTGNLGPPGNVNPFCSSRFDKTSNIDEVGISCPNWRLDGSERNFSLDAAIPVAGNASAVISAQCSDNCFISSTLSCEEPNPGPPVDLPCAPADNGVSRTCQLLSGGSNCPGFCERGDGFFCGVLSGNPTASFDQCDIVLTEPGGQCGGSFESDAGSDDPVSLATLWQLCRANPVDLRCVDPPGHDDDIENLVCGGSGGDPVCDLCSSGLGLGCIPIVDVPADLQTGPSPVGSGGDGGGSFGCPCGEIEPGRCGECSNSSRVQPSARTTPRTGPRLANPRLHQQMGADPVALGTGELVHDVTDVAFDSRGVSFAFTRSYRSGGLRSGALGPGWSHSFEERVVPVGDRFNREGVPAYCVEALPEIRCVMRTDGGGGVSLWTLDPVRRTFVPPAGEMGSIAVLYQAPAYAQRARDVADLAPLEGGVIEHVAPGGIRRIYDLTGMLVSITDEMGFGLVLTWERKTESQAALDGPWTNVEMTTLRGPPTSSLEAGLVTNLLNLHELVQVTDSYGRDFDFEYETIQAGTEKRRRLAGLHHRGSELLHFEYEPFARTRDAYLSSVERRGFQAPGASALSGYVEYAYARDIFAAGGLFEGAPGNYVGALANLVDDALEASEGRVQACASAGGASPHFAPEVNDRCAQSYSGSGPHPGMQADTGAETMWRVIERAVADNIVRIAVDGDIELESRYDVDPFSVTFDHVLEQRYGQVAAPLTTPLDVEEDGRVIHTWHTNMPQAQLSYSAGTVQPIAGLLPERTHQSVEEDDVVLPTVCDFPELQQFPLFYPEDPAGAREDLPSTLSGLLETPPVLAVTAKSCASVAGTYARSVDSAGIWPGADGVTRALRSWNLNLVCSWVTETDRRGVAHVHGLNYEGTPLVEVHPSPTGTGTVVFKRKVNADGLIIEQTQPDLSKTTITFGMLDRLNRNLPTEIRQDAAPASATLPAPKSEALSGAAVTTTTRTTTLTWEPYFQNPLMIVDPVGTTHQWRYQWQELRAISAGGFRFKAHGAMHGVLPPIGVFLGVDIDGDGQAYGDSAGEVLHFIDNVQLGGGTGGDVGTRTTRDETGRVTDTWDIVDADNPSLDFNRTSFRYYQNLAKAELGDLSIGNCKKPCGPLGEITRHRTRTSTAANDLDVSFFAYDIHGAVRLQRENNDAATDLVTERNARGHVSGELRYGVESLSYTRDPRGRVVSVKHSTPDTPTEQSAFAWGLDQTQLGSCEELVDGACVGFEAFALSVFGAVRANAALPAALPGANYSIVVVDAEDNVIATVGPDGFESTVVRLLDGSVQSLTTVGTPNTVDTYVYDVMGRLVRESRGSSGTVLLRSHHRYDGFGRLVDTLTRAPLTTTSFPAGTPTTGTVHSTGYDLGDRVVRVSEFGDSSAAARHVLSLQRFEVNAIGAPLFTHAHVASSLATTAVGKSNSGVDANDVFATESFRYDTAQRITRVDREGMTTPWTATYDHFGPTDLSSPTLSQVKVTHVPKLRTTQRIVDRRAEGTGAVVKQMTTTEVRNARQLVESVQWLDTDAPARSRFFTYDGRGRLVLRKDAANRTVATTYGRLSRVEQISEAAGARFTTFAYDTRGRVIERDPSDGPATDYDYDLTGRVVFEQTGDISLSVVRDAAGRLLSRDQNVRGAVRTLSLSFDPNRVRPFKVLVDGFAAKEFTRDGLDRPTLAVDANLVFAAESPSGFAASRPAVRSALTYDAAGRVKQDQTTALFPASSLTLPGQDVTIANLTTTWPTSNFRGPSNWGLFSGELRDASYNVASGLPSAIGHTGASGQKITVGLSWQGGQHVRSAIGTNVVARERDGLGQIRATTLSFGSTVPFRENVLRGPEGHVTSRLTTASLLVTRAHAHQYDPLQRLKQTKQDMASTQNLTTFRGFYDDAAVNETTTPVTTSINATVNHTLGDGDTLTNATTDEQGRTYSASFDINEAGIPPEVVNGGSVGRDGRDRIQTDNTLSYTFDALDRLVLVRRGSEEELRIAYDGLGRRRLERRLENTGSGTVVDVALEYIGGNVIEERDLDNNKVFLGMMHVPGELDAPITAVPGPLVSGGERYLLGVAVRGDVTTALSFKAAATVVEQQILDAYGEREARTATGSLCVEGKEVGSISKPQQTCVLSILNRFGITGARQHARTKLVDLRNRVYAPHLRGFLTKDPLGSIDSDGQWNYVAQDPINLKDPLGLAAFTGTGHTFVMPEAQVDGDPCAVGGCPPATAPAAEPGRQIPGIRPGGPDPESRPDDPGAYGPGDRPDVPGAPPGPGEPPPPGIPPTPPGDFIDGVNNSAIDTIIESAKITMCGPLIGVCQMYDMRAAIGSVASDPSRVVDLLPVVPQVNALRRECPSNTAACGEATANALRVVVEAVIMRKLLKAPKKTCGCFTRDTLVETPEGLVPIADLKVGDIVLARDEHTGEWGWHPVTEVFVRRTHEWLAIEVQDDDGAIDVYRATPEHPFFVLGGGWVEAGHLAVGDVVSGATGDLTITRLSHYAEDVTVFNLEVEGAHTYFVGELGAWVHNNPCTISTVAPDWGQKGAHIKVNGVEIAVRPAGGGNISLKPVFSSTDPAAFRAASKIATEALGDATFRGQLHSAAGRAIDLLRGGNSFERARAGELRHLQHTLTQMGIE